MFIGLIPCVLSLATRVVREEDPDTIQNLAEQLTAACRKVGAESSSPERWDLMAELIGRAFTLSHSRSQLREWGSANERSQIGCFDILVQLVACIDASPSEAAASMLSLMPRLVGCMPTGTTAHRELLVPFVETYWKQKFTTQRFLFGRAMVVESQLPHALALPLNQRVVGIFRVIHSAFQFRGEMPEEVRTWLFG
jgi:hypothetical protein